MTVALRWLPLQDVDAATLSAWTELGRQMPRANPFAMPQFVLPGGAGG